MKPQVRTFIITWPQNSWAAHVVAIWYVPDYILFGSQVTTITKNKNKNRKLKSEKQIAVVIITQKRNTEAQRRATLRQTSDSLQQLILLKRHWNILSFFILFSNFLFHVDWKLSFCSGREKKKRNASVNAKTNEEKKICPCPHKCSVPLRRGEIHSGSWIHTQSVQCHHFSDLGISLAAPGCVLGFHAEFCRRVVGHFSFWEGWFFFGSFEDRIAFWFLNIKCRRFCDLGGYFVSWTRVCLYLMRHSVEQ